MASTSRTTPSPQPSADAPAAPAPLATSIKSQWMLDPSIAFLNHGCFGARLRCVAEKQQWWRDRIESRPVEWLDRRRDELLAEAKQAVGRFLGMSHDNFGFVTNATGGVNAVMRSLEFSSGDEILTFNHVYNAVRMTMRCFARRVGATAIEARLPFPIVSPDEAAECLEAAITDRTRLVILDHVTSPTALRLPLERMLEACHARGVDVLVDGAHAPGMIEMDIESLGAAYYTGNLHKWPCAPMGTAFLWVRPDKQKQIHPLTISHFLDEGLAAEFAWQGTRDISGWLSAPEAIDAMDRLYGWGKTREHNHAMAVWAQYLLCERWGVERTSPADGSMLGSMVTVPLPEAARHQFESAEALQARLYETYAIEVPVIDWENRWWIRPSCQVYNLAEQYERLADAVAKETTE